MVKKRRFKDVNNVYYEPGKGLCIVGMLGKKPTSKWRYVTDLPCKGISAHVEGIVQVTDYDTHVLFNKNMVCELDPIFEKIMCPPLKRG